MPTQGPTLLKSVDITAPLQWVDFAMATQYAHFTLDIVDLAIHGASDPAGTGVDYISFAFSEDNGTTFHIGPTDYQTTLHRFLPPAVNPAGIECNQFFDSLGSGNFFYASSLSNNNQPDYLRATWDITPANHATVLARSVGPYPNGYTCSERVQCRLEASPNRQNLMRLRLYGNVGAVPPQPPFPPDPNDTFTAGKLRFWGWV